MLHCERCGREAAPHIGSYRYCVACGLYVCAASCWHPSGFCVGCAPSLSRRTISRDVALLRRVDRRLREARRETAALAMGGTRRVGSDDVPFDLACLERKHASAVAVYHSVLGQRMSADRRERLRRLTDRIHRNAIASGDAIEHAAAAANPAPSAVLADRLLGLGRRVVESLEPSRRSAHLAFAAAALVVVLVAVYVSALPPSRPPEGVLSGVPPPASVADPPPDDDPSAGGVTPPASATPAPAVLVDVTFDDDRIGPLASAGWAVGAAIVEVSAYPTPFDRSLAVSSADGTAVEACFAIEDAVRFGSAGITLHLDDAASTVATVTLRDPTSTPVLVVTASQTETTVENGGGTMLLSGEGLSPDAWYTVSVEESAGEVVVEVSDGAGAGLPASRASIDETFSVASVCLGVSGTPGASAHYDNLHVRYERSAA